MIAVLDSGALIALDRHDRTVGSILKVYRRDGVPVHTSASAVAQVWRDGRTQANLARALRGFEVVVLDELEAKDIGKLLRENGTCDLVDAHVALLVEQGGQVLTSDVPGIKALLRTRGVRATILRV